jgi:hypothetical protein
MHLRNPISDLRKRRYHETVGITVGSGERGACVLYRMHSPGLDMSSHCYSRRDITLLIRGLYTVPARRLREREASDPPHKSLRQEQTPWTVAAPPYRNLLRDSSIELPPSKFALSLRSSKSQCATSSIWLLSYCAEQQTTREGRGEWVDEKRRNSALGSSSWR